jgi:2,4-dienoyl-CoA reductase-like NADH-dependent reductase (Old Yellow Enzyme family)
MNIESNQPLLKPIRLGDLDLPNRVVMAPLTRMGAANPELVPTGVHAEVTSVSSVETNAPVSGLRHRSRALV